MSDRRCIYLERAFWDEFTERFHKLLSSVDESTLDDVITCKDMNTFITHSDITVDCTLNEFSSAAQSNINLQLLWKKKANGECNIEFHDKSFTEVDSMLSMNPLMVLFTKEDRGSSAGKYGVININMDNVISKRHYFKDNGTGVKNGENWDWETFRGYASEAANSLVIVDNYIFKGDLRSNLYKILDIVLPKKLSIPFHITIFYIESKPGAEEKLKEYIKRIRPDLDVMIEFVKTCKDANNSFKTDFHDRALISNNIWIDSGAGFNILKQDRLHYKSDKSTTIRAAHLFFASRYLNWINSATSNLIEDARETLKRNNILTKNRLLK